MTDQQRSIGSQVWDLGTQRSSVEFGQESSDAKGNSKFAGFTGTGQDVRLPLAVPFDPEPMVEIPDVLMRCTYRNSIMRISKLSFTTVVAVGSSCFMAAPALAAHDPCKVLTAETFTKVMGYGAPVKTTGSTEMSCFYSGPGNSGGQFTILSEAAAGPQLEAMLKGRGSAPPPGSGMVGGTFKEGTVVFSVSIKSTDESKVQALVAEIRRNLR